MEISKVINHEQKCSNKFSKVGQFRSNFGSIEIHPNFIISELFEWI
jgi:hypothetical protein